MKRLLVVAVLAAIGAGDAQAAAGVPPLVPRDLAPLAEETHSLVQLAGGTTAPAAEAALRRAGGERVSRRLRIWRVPSAAARELFPSLALAGALLDAEPDRPRRRLDHGAAGDDLLPSQWWIARVGADREPPGPGVPVTVVDSGVDFSHPEFAGRPNTIALNEQTVRGRDELHGTAVASVVAAPANGVGLVGVYPQAVLRSWDASPNGVMTTASVIRGIDAAAAAGRGVINLSLGGAFRSRLEEQVVLNAFDRGSLVVAASGNDREEGNLPTYPASLPHVLTVGASDADDQVASFSSGSPGMDLLAPGVRIPVAVPANHSVTGFLTVPGTSFATPIVSGAAAWVWTQRPELEKTQLFELMRRSARPLGPGARNPDSGFGILDIGRALELPAPPVDPHEPNDELEQVTPGALFVRGKPALTGPARGAAALTARLDVTDDPRDVYRVWLPARGRVVATVTGPAAVELRFVGPTPIRRTSRIRARQLELVNRTARGASVYVAATIRPGARPSFATYRLRITTGPAPARR